jgi:hypothetical protein
MSNIMSRYTVNAHRLQPYLFPRPLPLPTGLPFTRLVEVTRGDPSATTEVSDASILVFLERVLFSESWLGKVIFCDTTKSLSSSPGDSALGVDTASVKIEASFLTLFPGFGGMLDDKSSPVSPGKYKC